MYNSTHHGLFSSSILLLVLFLCAVSGYAETASSDEALQVGRNWLSYIVSQKGGWSETNSPEIIDYEEITDIIREYNGRLASILTSTSRAPDGYRYLYVRVYNLDRSQVQSLLDELKDTTTLLYMVDHRENKREEFTKRSEAA